MSLGTADADSLEHSPWADHVAKVRSGAQAAVLAVAAVSAVTRVRSAEIVACLASGSTGLPARADIEVLEHTTAEAIEGLGGAELGHAVFVVGHIDPALTMRGTAFCLVEEADRSAIAESVDAMLEQMGRLAPGVGLKHAVQFSAVEHGHVPALGRPFHGTEVAVFVEVAGACSQSSRLDLGRQPMKRTQHVRFLDDSSALERGRHDRLAAARS